MRTCLFALLLFFARNTFSQDVLPKVSSGSLQRIENFKSRFVTSRNIDVWLPESYDGKKKFSVLYMHDGQMLFDSTTTWNKQSWDVDDEVSKLIKSGKIQDCIVVALWNGVSTRHTDYFPQKAFTLLSDIEKDTVNQQLQRAGRIQEKFIPNADNYLRFLVQELKPFIDKKFKVFKDKAHTYVAGSSMGGLISMYAICEYPKVFGGAACLSTHWVGTFTLENNPIPAALLQYLETHLPKAGKNKLYFDCGDQTLDALYPDIQKKVDTVMTSKGYTSRNWKTIYVKNSDHSEKAWKSRLDKPLIFLLGK
jgi:enterochelin esterase-like enzyme